MNTGFLRTEHSLPEAPLRSRTVGFPESGSDLGYRLQVLLAAERFKRWRIYTPLAFGLRTNSSCCEGRFFTIVNVPPLRVRLCEGIYKLVDHPVQVLVALPQVVNFMDGMQDGGVVLPAELPADFR